MLGNQQQNQSQNPFVGYQTFYLNLFSNVMAPDEEGYAKGVNDTTHFRLSMVVDSEMKKNAAVLNLTGGKDYFNLPNDYKVTGYLKSISTFKETVKGKPVKKIQITLYDPEAQYLNPFESVDASNPKNNTVVGATYIIKTSFTLKGKELVSKLTNLDPSLNEMVSIIVVPANTAESGYKEQIVINGKKIYNILVKQGSEVLHSRFGDPSKSSRVQHDKWNTEYLDILEKYEDETRRINMDNLFERFINQIFTPSVHSMFLNGLKSMGYDLVESGTNQDGSAKFKYVKLGETVDTEQFSTYVEPYEDDTQSVTSKDFDSNELPF
jgi:hypothetical protein